MERDGRHRRLLFVLHGIIGVVLWLCGAPTVVVHAAIAAEDNPKVWTLERIPDPIHKGGAIVNAYIASPADNEHRHAMVRCWTATGLLDVRFQLGRKAPALTGDVTWRFDRGAVGKAQWRISAMGDGLVVPDALQRTFLRSMRSARALELRLTEQDREQLLVVVPLTGSSMPIAQVAAACGAWP